MADLPAIFAQAIASNSINDVLTILSNDNNSYKDSHTNEELLALSIPWTDSEGKHLVTPAIFVAIDYGHVEMIRALLPFFMGNDDNRMIDTIRSGQGDYTALQWACWMGHLEIVQLLVQEGGARIDSEALSLAREYNHTQVVEYLLQQNTIDLYSDIPDKDDLDAIMDRACREGDVTRVRQLLQEENYNLDKWKDEEGRYLALSPMYMAVKFGHYNVVSLFMEEREEEKDHDKVVETSVIEEKNVLSEIMVEDNANEDLVNVTGGDIQNERNSIEAPT